MDRHAGCGCLPVCSCAPQLRTWTPQGYPSESGFFWLRAVLMLLCVKRTDVAESLLMNHSDVDWSGLESVPAPLQVAYLLVAACKAGSINAFNLILRKYNVLLRRDPFFARCADKIKLEVFGVARPQALSLSSLFSLFTQPAATIESA
ncbi:uncharacterized protein LOC113147470 [Cyclospora cayetanensis]|uniref:Uncharacterized protein LOC113147470 n=1 Tax=Cyclospora cayetanensis TaxID=88456 RepID=A0A6P6S2N4_9EIME|nr:uncharacterized protein LOC113147470 [Cyclospora cayetanensis]